MKKIKTLFELEAGSVTTKMDGGTLKFLTIYRTKMNDFTLPKGHVEEGESLEEASIRETFEETGHQISTGEALGSFEYTVKEKKDGEDFNLYDVKGNTETQKPDETLIQESLKVEIDRALDRLPEREATVIRLYYGIGNSTSKSLNEIGELYDISRERVRQVKEKALRKLKHKSKNKVLRTYLG